MKTLNLARKEYSDIDYEIINFPDGQKQLNIKECLCNWKDGVIEAVTRLCNGDDLFLLMQLDDILNRNGIMYKLKITYLIGARCDRLFSYTQPFTLDVVTKLLLNLSAVSIDFVELHSNENSLIKLNTDRIANYEDIAVYRLYESDILHDNSYIRVYPDKGSLSRYRNHEFDKNKIICSKVRDVNTGKLSGFKVESIDEGLDLSLPLYLVDDLCDGGGTFLGLSELIRKELNPTELNLVVTHAIQKSGLEKVSKVYDKVYITNSFYDWDKESLPSNIIVIDVLRNSY